MTIPMLPARAGFIQFDCIQGAWQANLATVRAALTELAPPPASLICLPELWATGFAYERLAELAAITPQLLAALAEEAGRHHILIAGSCLEFNPERAAVHNTLFIVGGQGVVGRYRKQQLFSPMEEDRHFTPGDQPLPIVTELGLMACLVCYDLRFPELAARQVGLGARVIVVSAQWPMARKGHWLTLLTARAIENQAFVVAGNRSGTTGDTTFAGSSVVIDPSGQIMVEADDRPGHGLVALDPGLLTEVRSRFRTAGVTPHRYPDAGKVMELPALQAELVRVREIGRQVVFTNGCFDILHQGHVTYLEAARKQGDCLVVGVNSDASIRAIKGPTRPVNGEMSRARVLAALGCVDYVVVFGEETPLTLITALLPDILVKGADWPIDKIVGGAEVLARGGRVLTIPTVADFSTTRVIEVIRGKG
jgi:rfaE bifunctional protein nucleotidyltransferase chain/domain